MNKMKRLSKEENEDVLDELEGNFPPKRIEKKLREIVFHYEEVLRLIGEIETWKPQLEDTLDNDKGWSFSMHLFQQPRYNYDDLVELLKIFLDK
jgi:hypothetical protein